MSVSLQEFTLILSFLKRKREGDFANVSDRLSCKKFAKGTIQNAYETSRNGGLSGKSFKFAKSHSRICFKNERTIEIWKGKLLEYLEGEIVGQFVNVRPKQVMNDHNFTLLRILFL